MIEAIEVATAASRAADFVSAGDADLASMRDLFQLAVGIMGVLWALLLVVVGLVLRLNGKRMEERLDESARDRAAIRHDQAEKHSENRREFAAIKELIFEEGRQQRTFNHQIDLRVSKLEWGRERRRREDYDNGRIPSDPGGYERRRAGPTEDDE